MPPLKPSPDGAKPRAQFRMYKGGLGEGKAQHAGMSNCKLLLPPLFFRPIGEIGTFAIHLHGRYFSALDERGVCVWGWGERRQRERWGGVYNTTGNGLSVFKKLCN